MLEMKYFVLKPKAKDKNDVFARASQEAMCTYADCIRDIDPDFARELDLWAQKECVTQERIKHV